MIREEAIVILDGFKHNPLFNEQHFEAFDMAISALSAEPCREADDYENEIADLHNRLDIAEYDKERYKEEITILEAENKGEWIPVSERLPEEGKNVLFCDIDNDIMLGYHLTYAPATHFVERGAWEDVKNVRAWMPLPEPYKKGGE